MAYRFNGFFARPSVERPVALPAGAVWRAITTPFIGVGVWVTGLGHDEPGPDEARVLLTAVGLGSASDWLYLNYVTWAGRIDHVYGLGVSGSKQFGPVGESDVESARAAYLGLMSEFGVDKADALNFPPFVRGFWGE